MGADRYRERQNMKEARHVESLYSYELVALDEEGEEVYRTEAFHTEEEARKAACDANSSTGSTNWSELPDEVVRFTYDEYEE